MSTLRIFRITHRSHGDEAYSGKGGLFAPGRWHSRGRLVCYASESLALAVLEQLARTGSLSRLREMVYVPATLDEQAVLAPDEQELPGSWNRHPPGRASQEYGDAWLAAEATVALRLPSVILPKGFNYVLNPSHPHFDRALAAGEPRSLELDPRVIERFRRS